MLADDLNPFTNRRRFRRHKTLPPRIRVYKATKEVAVGRNDQPREMTVQEREWQSSPYLRMLSSPLRSCLLTGQHLPRDILIRVAPMQLPAPRGSQPAQMLMPSGLEHARFRSHKVGRGGYFVCRKDAIDQMSKRTGWYNRLGRHLKLHSKLSEHISHLLRLRVIQEIELLADRLRCAPRGAHDNPVLRRLTRAELKLIRSTGVIPYPSAVALLIVPPLNKNPTTKERPKPNHTSLPHTEEGRSPPVKNLPPTSTIHPAWDVVLDSEGPDHSVELLSPRIPLYNGLALFPSRAQRTALHAGLNALLAIERQARYRLHGRPAVEHSDGGSNKSNSATEDKWARGDQKASHGYLLCSDSGTLLRADAVPLAIALWRLHMWEGASWEGTAETLNGWKMHPPRHTNDSSS